MKYFRKYLLIMMLFWLLLPTMVFAAGYLPSAQIGARNRVYPKGIRGDSNMSIVIMDTGLDPIHPGFQPMVASPNLASPDWTKKTIMFRDYDNSTAVINDETHHGTHTSYLAAGNPGSSVDNQGRTRITSAWNSGVTVAGGGLYPEYGGFFVDTPGQIRLRVWVQGAGYFSEFHLMYSNNKLGNWVDTGTRNGAVEPVYEPFDFETAFEGGKQYPSFEIRDGGDRAEIMDGWTSAAALYNVPIGQWVELTYNVDANSLGYYRIVTRRVLNGDRIRFIVDCYWPTSANEDGIMPDGEYMFSGIAPRSKIVHMLAKTPSQWNSAFNWLNTGSNVDLIKTAVVSISQGTSSTSYGWTSTIPALFNNLGVITVAAAGNDGGSTSNNMSNPARFAEVVAVTASNAADFIMALSSTGGTHSASSGQLKPDVVAPGGGVILEGGLWSADFNGEGSNFNYGNPGAQVNWGYDTLLNDYVPFYGTSMATPIVAGALNLIIDAMGGWAYWSNPLMGSRVSKARKAKQLLFMTCTETNLGREQRPQFSPVLNRGYNPNSALTPEQQFYGKDAHEGYGRINVDAAVDVLTEPVLSGDFHASGSLWSSRSAFINGVGDVYPSTGHPLSPIDWNAVSSPKAWARQIWLESGQEHRITLNVPATADFDLYLYHFNPAQYGDPLIAARSVNDGFGTDELIVYTPSSSGAFYLVIKAVDGKGSFLVYKGELSLPQIALNPQSLSFELLPSAQASQGINIINSGDPGSVLLYDISIQDSNVDRSVSDASITLNPENFNPGEFLELQLVLQNGSRNVTRDDVIIGTGTSTEKRPFDAYWQQGRSASLLTATELGRTGVITHLGWNVSTARTYNLPIKIYLKPTTATQVATTSWDITGATLVYDASYAFNTTGWHTLDITDYNYSGGNLLVLTEANYGGTGTASSVFFRCVNNVPNMHVWNQRGGNYTVDAMRPNIKLTFMDPSEPIQRVSLSFPAGVRVDSSSNITVNGAPTRRLITNNATGNGATIIWQNTSGQVNHGETATAMIYAFVQEGFAGTMQLPYVIEGDGTGDLPHSISGTLSLINNGPILPTLTVMTPNGGNRVPIGTSYGILWSATGTIPGVNILLSRNNGQSWETIVQNTPNDGYHEWSVNAPASSQCIIKIESIADAGIYDVSNSTFTIFQPVTWLGVNPNSGSIAASLAQQVLVNVNTQNIAPGSYTAYLKVDHNAGNALYFPVYLVVNDPHQSPNAPQNLVIVITDDGARLSWSPVAGAEIYHIYRSEHPDSGFEYWDSAFDTNWTDGEVYDRFFYYVTASSTRIVPSATININTNKTKQ